MNRLLILISLIGFGMLSCEKESNQLTHLTGKWSWTSSSGGFSGTTYTPQSTGDRKIVEFSNDSIFKLFQNDTLLIESKYHLKVSKSIYSQDSALLIIYDNSSIRQSYNFKVPNILILRDECDDCFEHIYKRTY